MFSPPGHSPRFQIEPFHFRFSPPFSAFFATLPVFILAADSQADVAIIYFQLRAAAFRHASPYLRLSRFRLVPLSPRQLRRDDAFAISPRRLFSSPPLAFHARCHFAAAAAHTFSAFAAHFRFERRRRRGFSAGFLRR